MADREREERLRDKERDGGGGDIKRQRYRGRADRLRDIEEGDG